MHDVEINSTVESIIIGCFFEVQVNVISLIKNIKAAVLFK